MITSKTFELNGLITAIESGNTQCQLALYAEGAELRISDSARPAGTVQVLRGRAAIAAWIDGEYSHHVTHRVVSFTANAESLTLVEECESSDGTPVRYARTAELASGQIRRETAVLMRAQSTSAAPRVPTGAEAARTRMVDQDPDSPSPAPPHRSRQPTAIAGGHLPGFYLG